MCSYYRHSIAVQVWMHEGFIRDIWGHCIGFTRVIWIFTVISTFGIQFQSYSRFDLISRSTISHFSLCSGISHLSG